MHSYLHARYYFKKKRKNIEEIPDQNFFNTNEITFKNYSP